MFSIEANKEEIFAEFPIIAEWMEKMRRVRLDAEADTDTSKAEFYYTCGFFIPKVDDKVKYYTETFEKTSGMLYPERLDFELAKVRVNVTVKIGNFEITDRLPKGSMPSQVKSLIGEITKVKMMIETEYTENKEVAASIPQVDAAGEKADIIKYVIGQEYKDEKSVFEMDAILDKISKNGIESLTKDEKKFLDEKSKEM